MRLFEIDIETKLPTASAEARTIKEFYDILRRRSPMDGDADGRKKLLNEKELAFIYFSVNYDSRFKLLDGDIKKEAIKELLGMPKNWEPDQLVLIAIDKYNDTQITESSKTVQTMSSVLKHIQSQLETLEQGMEQDRRLSVKDMKDVLEISTSLPNALKSLKEAKETLRMEQDSNETGRGGRALNKFEEPDQI